MKPSIKLAVQIRKDGWFKLSFHHPCAFRSEYMICLLFYCGQTRVIFILLVSGKQPRHWLTDRISSVSVKTLDRVSRIWYTGKLNRLLIKFCHIRHLSSIDITIFSSFSSMQRILSGRGGTCSSIVRLPKSAILEFTGYAAETLVNSYRKIF